MTLLKQLEHKRSGGLLPKMRRFMRVQTVSVDWSLNDPVPHSISIHRAATEHAVTEHAITTRTVPQNASFRQSQL
jgi:hypothetical protein